MFENRLPIRNKVEKFVATAVRPEWCTAKEIRPKERFAQKRDSPKKKIHPKRNLTIMASGERRKIAPRLSKKE